MAFRDELSLSRRAREDHYAVSLPLYLPDTWSLLSSRSSNFPGAIDRKLFFFGLPFYPRRQLGQADKGTFHVKRGL